MNRVARITFEGGALLMPAQNQYDRELVFEEAEFYARRHGKVRLELNRGEMLIRTAENPSNPLCTTCGRGPNLLAFFVGGRCLCSRCARKSAR